ncbi:MAG: branched-chain amino acid ABC transporter permease [Spirochaetales bacterium]|nr:branched-chain amino acid ABC transporter permease [Spirochaetales bacterium]
MNLATFIVPIITGLATGMLVYLSASGMSLMISGMSTLNFSQGGFYILGAMLCYTVSKVAPFWVGLLVGFGVTFILGYLVELAVRPVFGNLIYSMVVTLAVTYIVTDGLEALFGSNVRLTSLPTFLSKTFYIGKLAVPSYYLFIIVISSMIAVAFWLMFYKSRIGMYFRAIISDRTMVESLGINVKFMFSLMFMIGVGLAGIAGALNSPLSGISSAQSLFLFGQVTPCLMIGGLRNMKGALPAALLVGVSQALAAIFIPTYYNVVPSVLMVICMFFKPEGLFVKKGA